MPQPFTELTAVAAVLLRDNIDTDAIIPSWEIRTVGNTGLADGLFANSRYLPGQGRTPDPEFVLNDPACRGSRILIAGENLGCGSSREHAVWALAEYGFRALIAPSFNPIFYRNCLRNGVLPARLAPEAIATLAQWVTGDPRRHQPIVSLVTQRILAAVGAWSFEIAADAREALLEGLGEIERTLRLSGQIAAFQAADRLRRPWAYDLGHPKPGDDRMHD
jgi:3-isopropylmalate/(R)-2-methylmalate dehydratase small subunit